MFFSDVTTEQMQTEHFNFTTLFEHSGLQLLQSLFAILVAWFVYRLIARALQRIASNGFIPHEMHVILHLVSKWLVFIVLILVILGLLGISVTSFWAALSGILALIAIGVVAVWSVLSNILCSVLLVIFGPFRIADIIEIQDPAAPVSVRGKVTGINLMFTTLLVNEGEDDEHIISIPNNIFFQKYVRNWRSNKAQTLKQFHAQQHESEHNVGMSPDNSDND